MLGRGHQRSVPETVARWVPVPPWWRPGVGIVHVLLLSSEGILVNALRVILRLRMNQRCVCVTSVVLVRSAPCDPGVCVVSPLPRSASCAGFSDGAIPRRL